MTTTDSILKSLNEYKESLIQDELNNYNSDYIKSKWFKMPTLREAVGESLSDDFERFEDSLENGTADLNQYLQLFEARAKEYGASWYDEDLDKMRSGYEFETEFYVKLRNIIADALDISKTRFNDYFEGYGI